MDRIEKVVIIGMGALGVLYGNFFASKLGAEQVTFLADAERTARYKKEGVFCNGEKCSFCMETPEEYAARGEEAQLLLVAVKASALDKAAELARSVVGRETAILSVLNGISSEAFLEERLGTGSVIYCVAQGMDAVKEGNVVTYRHLGQLCIGLPRGEEEKKGTAYGRVREFFARTGLPFTAETDILHRLWSKWMMNVGVNQVVMVEEGTYETVQRPGPARERMKAAMREVIAIAGREGIGVTEQDLEEYVALLDTLNPDGMPSMRQDGLAGRPTEVELFAGTVLKKAEALGLDVPVNRALYREIRQKEQTGKN